MRVKDIYEKKKERNIGKSWKSWWFKFARVKEGEKNLTFMNKSNYKKINCYFCLINW